MLTVTVGFKTFQSEHVEVHWFFFKTSMSWVETSCVFSASLVLDFFDYFDSIDDNFSGHIAVGQRDCAPIAVNRLYCAAYKRVSWIA